MKKKKWYSLSSSIFCISVFLSKILLHPIFSFSYWTERENSLLPNHDHLVVYRTFFLITEELPSVFIPRIPRATFAVISSSSPKVTSCTILYRSTSCCILIATTDEPIKSLLKTTKDDEGKRCTRSADDLKKSKHVVAVIVVKRELSEATSFPPPKVLFSRGLLQASPRHHHTAGGNSRHPIKEVLR